MIECFRLFFKVAERLVIQIPGKFTLLDNFCLPDDFPWLVADARIK